VSVGAQEGLPAPGMEAVAPVMGLGVALIFIGPAIPARAGVLSLGRLFRLALVGRVSILLSAEVGGKPVGLLVEFVVGGGRLLRGRGRDKRSKAQQAR
jgi:hypothetical protein